MNSVRFLRGSWWCSGLFLPLITLALTGCFAPKATLRSSGKLETYRKVYLAPIENDPRSVHPRILSRLKQSGFEVVEMKKDGPPLESQGSGFVLTPEGQLLTCAHVLEGQTNATVWIQSKRYVGRVVTMDTNLDLALITVDGAHDPFRPLPFASDTNYHMGQDAYTMGFPLAEVLGTAPRLNKGLISSTVGMEDNPKQLQVSAEVQPGSSGAPLLNERGEAIGIVAATLNPMNVLARTGGNLPQNVNFAIKAGPIHEFLATANITLPAAAENQKSGFEEAKASLALVRGGIVEEADLKQPALLCRYVYASIWDVWFRFRVFHIEFYDLKKGEWVLKAGQYGDNMFSSEDGVLDRTFEEICAKFFPERPNPFKGTKTKPKPEPKPSS
ncbi:MAG: trypsin-like peptidase domain-containing protein [Verrucomicrobia bacterium]|nr:trypsin-like peptidase domain-containing protein [Verrucomicrobiota bacterium]